MNKRYCFSDVHGEYSLWKQIKEYCDETDIIYFLGDACDRGKDGLKIIQELLEDNRVIYLKGNHEEMFSEIVSNVISFFNKGIIEENLDEVKYWDSNGGLPTMESISKNDTFEMIKLGKRLEKLPETVEFVNKKGQNIFLSHAGTCLDYSDLDIFCFGKQRRFLWDRKHYTRKWSSRPEHVNSYVIHGHTYAGYVAEMNHLPYQLDTVLFYNKGHKIDLDLASYDSHKIALLDLDNLENVKYFTSECK